MNIERTGAPGALVVLGLALAACTAEAPPTTGGTDIEPGPFGRGVFTVNQSDSYDSTNVSLVATDGQVLSESFLSQGLSGDVTAPSMPVAGDRVVLLDRWYSLVRWVDVKTGTIAAELHADADELARNPWDYLPISPDKAYVTRYDRWPGHSDHGDLIVIDPQTATVSTPVDKRIDIAPSLALGGDFIVHPARGVASGTTAYVVTVNATPTYEYTQSHLVAIDTATDEIASVLPLTGLHDCNALALSPSGEELAVACAGNLEANAALSQENAGIVLVSLSPLAEKARFLAADLGSGVPGFSLTYVTDTTLLALLVGNSTAGIPDTALLLDTATGTHRTVHTAPAVQLGAVLCPARVDGNTTDTTPVACFATDAEAARLLHFPVENADLGSPRAIEVDTLIGLPPRTLGQF
ncbi:MAG: hypothetical protein R3B70_31475 [Polyangiaceae bacterium]